MKNIMQNLMNLMNIILKIALVIFSMIIMILNLLAMIFNLLVMIFDLLVMIVKFIWQVCLFIKESIIFTYYLIRELVIIIIVIITFVWLHLHDLYHKIVMSKYFWIISKTITNFFKGPFINKFLKYLLSLIYKDNKIRYRYIMLNLLRFIILPSSLGGLSISFGYMLDICSQVPSFSIDLSSLMNLSFSNFMEMLSGLVYFIWQFLVNTLSFVYNLALLLIPELAELFQIFGDNLQLNDLPGPGNGVQGGDNGVQGGDNGNQGGDNDRQPPITNGRDSTFEEMDSSDSSDVSRINNPADSSPSSPSGSELGSDSDSDTDSRMKDLEMKDMGVQTSLPMGNTSSSNSSSGSEISVVREDLPGPSNRTDFSCQTENIQEPSEPQPSTSRGEVRKNEFEDPQSSKKFKK